jgi:DNA gyrase/topoisomerase IV subunit A
VPTSFAYLRSGSCGSPGAVPPLNSEATILHTCSWDERQAAIVAKQEERLALLRNAILTREAEVEEGHEERVRAKTDKLLAAKAGAFAAVQKERVKAIRHFGDARRCASRDYHGRHRWCLAWRATL